MSDSEKELKILFRDYMAQELRSREVDQAKKAFIREHFSGGSSLIFRPVFILPALSLIFLVVLIFQIQRPAVKSVAEPLQKVILEKQISEPILEIPPGLEVKVREVSSDVGSPMVYQKSYHDVPITVVWVFTGGANQ